MSGVARHCPSCGHVDLDPRRILIGRIGPVSGNLNYQEIITLKCQACGWLGEASPALKQA